MLLKIKFRDKDVFVCNKMRRRQTKVSKLKNPIKFLFIVISISFLIIQIISLLQLSNISSSKATKYISPKLRSASRIGKSGESLIKLLPEDLKFTLFLPSEKAFDRDLRLNPNDSNSYAVLTRVLGFSAVPRWIYSGDLEFGKEMNYDSISGFSLYVMKDLNKMVVVNGVVAEEVDLRMGNILVHVVDGVVMDSEFEESMQPADEEEN